MVDPFLAGVTRQFLLRGASASLLAVLLASSCPVGLCGRKFLGGGLEVTSLASRGRSFSFGQCDFEFYLETQI